MKKRMIPLLLALLMLFSATSVSVMADYGGFRDVDEEDYYASAVLWAVANGVTTGTSSDTFSPDTICTRGQVVTFLWRAKGRPEPLAEENPFEDVASGSYYEKAVLWAVEQGITNGISDAPMLFSPETPCTYAQIITFLWRANGRPEPEFTSSMTDEWADSLYYKKAVTWGDNNALFEDEGGVFRSDTPCSRARTVAWLYRDAIAYVSDVQTFMNAIRPGRQIYLAPGTYNLTEWIHHSTSSEDGASATGNPYVELWYVDDGYEVWIKGVNNLGIFADPAFEGSVEIVTEPRYADVLSFLGCDQLILSDLTIGHTPEQGYCTGGVLYFEYCGRIAMSEMNLYGCGTYGITAKYVDSIQTVDSVIHDCSYGLLDFNSVTDAGFGGVVFRDCDGYDMLDVRDSQVYFQDCAFYNNTWSDFFDFLVADDSSEIHFGNCDFDFDTLKALTDNARYGKNVFVENETVLGESPNG